MLIGSAYSALVCCSAWLNGNAVCVHCRRQRCAGASHGTGGVGPVAVRATAAALPPLLWLTSLCGARTAAIAALVLVGMTLTFALGVFLTWLFTPHVKRD